MPIERIYGKHHLICSICGEASRKPGDELEFDGRRWPVIAASTIPGLDGKEAHREVAV